MWERINNSSNIQIFLVFAIVFGGGIFWYLQKDACEDVITYRVEGIDPKFDITQEEAERAVERAVAIWETELVLDLFEPAPDGELLITFKDNGSGEIQDGQEFDKGDYFKGTVNVYQFFGTNDLVLLLAHEFGHVLGVEHVDDASAIMNPVLSAVDRGSLLLRDADKAAFAQACGIYK